MKLFLSLNWKGELIPNKCSHWAEQRKLEDRIVTRKSRNYLIWPRENSKLAELRSRFMPFSDARYYSCIAVNRDIMNTDLYTAYKHLCVEVGVMFLCDPWRLWTTSPRYLCLHSSKIYFWTCLLDFERTPLEPSFSISFSILALQRDLISNDTYRSAERLHLQPRINLILVRLRQWRYLLSLTCFIILVFRHHFLQKLRPSRIFTSSIQNLSDAAVDEGIVEMYT